MSDPTSDLEAWAATYRELRRPSPARRRAIRAAVAASAAAEDRRIRRQRWLGLGVVLAAGVLGVLALGQLLLGRATRVAVDEQRSLAPHAASGGEVHEARAGEAAPRRGADPTSQDPAAGAGLDVNAEAAPVDGEAAASGGAKPWARASERRRTTIEPDPAAPPMASDELESMRLLRDAERGLETDPAASLRLLERHEQRFPGSTLALEREALTVIALCRLGRTDAGRERQRRLSQSPGGSVYAARVRSACGDAP